MDAFSKSLLGASSGWEAYLSLPAAAMNAPILVRLLFVNAKND
jgi:hypothetical protein